MSSSNSPWVHVTLADVQACIPAEALSLAQTRAAQRQLPDPFTAHQPKIVARVRNKVAVAPGARLSADGLAVPPELAGQTALLIGYGIVLPVSAAQPDLLGPEILAAVKQAEKDLDDAAAGRFAVSLPDDPLPSNPVASSGPVQTVGGHLREATRDSLRGL